MTFVFPRNNCVMSPAFLEVAEYLPTCLPVGSREWTPCFALLCLHMQVLLYLAYCISTHEFSHFHLSDFLPHPTWGEWVSGRMLLSYLLGLNHNSGDLFLMRHSVSPCGLGRIRQAICHQEGWEWFVCAPWNRVMMVHVVAIRWSLSLPTQIFVFFFNIHMLY